MPAITHQECDAVAPEKSTETTITIASGPAAPGLARQHVRGQLPADLSAGRLCDLVLLTSELVTNAVEHSAGALLQLTVAHAETFTRIEVRSPGEPWAGAPESHAPEPEQSRGWGLFLVEQLSDRWGTTDADSAVWFEFDHPTWPLTDVWAVLQQIDYPATRAQIVAAARTAVDPPSATLRLQTLDHESYEHAEEACLELVYRRAEAKPGLAVTAADLRSGEDRREVSMTVEPADERRSPNRSHGTRRNDTH
jgi:anti-sigma regulatory factor (Ser/Thr protein kinase)